MFATKQTAGFESWLEGLADTTARKRIAARIVRVQSGNFGDVKSVGGKVSELRVDYGPGFRVYFTRRGAELIILLCGGDKSTQQSDISKARQMVADLDKEEKAAAKLKKN